MIVDAAVEKMKRGATLSLGTNIRSHVKTHFSAGVILRRRNNR